MADIEEHDIGKLLPGTAIERMARFFLLKMEESEKEKVPVHLSTLETTGMINANKEGAI